MLIQSIHYTFAPEDGDRAAHILEQLQGASRREPGVLGFEVARSEEHPGVFALWEEYRDEQARATHVASEHFQRLVVHGLRQLAKERRAEVGFSLEGTRQTAAGADSTGPESRLRDLGVTLPTAPLPLGAYVEAVQSGNLLFLSGMLPTAGHEPQFVGRLGAEYDVDTGREALRVAALNALAAARTHLTTLDRIARIVRLGVYLATAGDFFNHPQVADAASELFASVFGRERGSVRVVYGVASLPLGVPVELDVIFEVAAATSET